MSNLVTKISKEEKKEISERYDHWDKDNIVELGGKTFSKTTGRYKDMAWTDDKIEEEIITHHTPYILEQLKKYPFAKKNSERLWLIIKLEEFELHTNDYVENRIENDTLYTWDSLTEELELRIHFKECSQKSSDYIESRINSYLIKTHSDEIQKRIILKIIETGGDENVNFRSDFIESRIKNIKCKDLEQEFGRNKT